MADEVPEEDEASASDERDWAPPREVMTLLAGLAALACAALVVVGVPHKWTAPTLGVILVLGLAESLVAIGLAVSCALAERRRKAIFIPATFVTALGTIALAGILLLSGII